MHRDLKLTNLFLTKNGTLKIGDFGCSTKVGDEDNQRLSFCGTEPYIAPEIGKEAYGTAVDIYAIGYIFSDLDNITMKKIMSSDERKKKALLQECFRV